MANTASQRLWTKNFIMINLCVMFASFTNFCFIYILPVHVLRIGGSNTQVGLMGAGLTIIGLITRLTMSPLVDRWGRKPMLVLGCCLFALNALGYLLLRDSVTGVLIMRCFSGFSQGILFPVPPTIISDVSPKERLVDALGYFGIASSFPAILSPVLGLFLYENVSTVAFFAVTLISSIISFGLSFLYKDVYVPQKAEAADIAATGSTANTAAAGAAGMTASSAKPRFSLNSVLELSILFPSLVFLFGLFGFSAVNNFTIAFGESRGIAGMSLFFTVHNIAIVITRLFAGKIGQYLPSKKIITLGLLIIGGGTLMVAFSTSLTMMLVASAIMAVGGTLYAQYLQADALLMVRENRRGVANSTLMLAQDIGGGVGAAAFGFTSEHFSYAVTFILAGIMTFLAIPFNYMGRKKER